MREGVNIGSLIPTDPNLERRANEAFIENLELLGVPKESIHRKMVRGGIDEIYINLPPEIQNSAEGISRWAMGLGLAASQAAKRNGFESLEAHNAKVLTMHGIQDGNKGYLAR